MSSISASYFSNDQIIATLRSGYALLEELRAPSFAIERIQVSDLARWKKTCSNVKVIYCHLHFRISLLNVSSVFTANKSTFSSLFANRNALQIYALFISIFTLFHLAIFFPGWKPIIKKCAPVLFCLQTWKTILLFSDIKDQIHAETRLLKFLELEEKRLNFSALLLQELIKELEPFIHLD